MIINFEKSDYLVFQYVFEICAKFEKYIIDIFFHYMYTSVIM